MIPQEKVFSELIFETLIPGVEKLMPIIEAKDLQYAWVEKARVDLRKAREQENYGYEHFKHVAKCPGIFGLQRQGWVLRTWQDICIETNGDLETFNWSSAIDQQYLCKEADHAVSWHGKEHFVNYLDNFPKDTLKTVIKINTGWRVFIPKGFNLLELPIPYSDENRFTVLPGMLSQGLAACNAQLLWHVTNGKVLIPAGTPLAQYVIIPEEKQTAVVRRVEDMTPHFVHILSNSNRFVK